MAQIGGRSGWKGRVEAEVEGAVGIWGSRTPADGVAWRVWGVWPPSSSLSKLLLQETISLKLGFLSYWRFDSKPYSDRGVAWMRFGPNFACWGVGDQVYSLLHSHGRHRQAWGAARGRGCTGEPCMVWKLGRDRPFWFGVLDLYLD